MAPDKRDYLYAKIRERLAARSDPVLHRGWEAVLHVAETPELGLLRRRIRATRATCAHDRLLRVIGIKLQLDQDPVARRAARVILLRSRSPHPYGARSTLAQHRAEPDASTLPTAVPRNVSIGRLPGSPTRGRSETAGGTPLAPVSTTADRLHRDASATVPSGAGIRTTVQPSGARHVSERAPDARARG